MPDGDKDDIRSLLEGAVDGTITADAPLPEADLGTETAAPAGETAEQKAERTRDEAGRFAKEPKDKAPRETLTLKPKVETPAKPIAEEVKTGDGKPVLKTGNDGKIAPVLAAPADWLGEAKIRWGRLDRSIQEEILKREGERAAAVAETGPIKELIDANREFLVNQAGSVVEAQRQMMQFARMSVDNPVQLAEHILRARGLDPRVVFSGQPGQAPAQNQPQDIKAFLAQLVQQELQPVRAQFAQQQSQQLNSTVTEIQAFAADPAHPFFNDVSADIKFLLESNRIPPGPPLTRLQQAYDQATWSSPTIRPHLMAAQGEEANTRKAAEVAAARAAQRTSVTGPPLNGATASTMDGSDGSIGGDLRAAMRAHTGAV